MASIDFICSFGNERTDEELFAQKLDEATMLTYQDPDFGFTVRYPSFFIEQPDTLDNNVGYARFSYGDYWANVILKCSPFDITTSSFSYDTRLYYSQWKYT